jgi:hypothetical protein
VLFGHSDDPVYAPIRAELAGLFITHKAELGIDDWSDERIVAETNIIMMALMIIGTYALAHGDEKGWRGMHGSAKRASGCPEISQR